MPELDNPAEADDDSADDDSADEPEAEDDGRSADRVAGASAAGVVVTCVAGAFDAGGWGGGASVTDDEPADWTGADWTGADFTGADWTDGDCRDADGIEPGVRAAAPAANARAAASFGTGLVSGSSRELPEPAFVEPALVEPALVEPALVEPALVELGRSPGPLGTPRPLPDPAPGPVPDEEPPDDEPLEGEPPELAGVGPFTAEPLFDGSLLPSTTSLPSARAVDGADLPAEESAANCVPPSPGRRPRPGRASSFANSRLLRLQRPATILVAGPASPAWERQPHPVITPTGGSYRPSLVRRVLDLRIRLRDL